MAAAAQRQRRIFARCQHTHTQPFTFNDDGVGAAAKRETKGHLEAGALVAAAVVVVVGRKRLLAKPKELWLPFASDSSVRVASGRVRLLGLSARL